MCGLCAAGILAGGAGLGWAVDRSEPTATPAREPLREPTVLRSSDGVLDVRLEVTTGPTSVAGRTATLLRYNGEVPGPTLVLHPGDHLAVELVNSSDQPTNLHTHGLAVSPEGHGDNPFVVVEPGQSFHYAYDIPLSQPAGSCWYHPHHHGMAAEQVFRGLYGAVIIEPAASAETDAAAAVRPTPQRVLVLSDISIDGNGDVADANALQRRIGREGELVMVNGQHRPQLTARPGARERWHLVNACTSRFLRLRLDGQRLDLIGIDLPLTTPREVQEIVLAPGNRADVMIGTRTGTSVLQAFPVERIAAGMSFGMGGGGSGGSGMGMGMGGAGTGGGGMGGSGMGGRGMGTSGPSGGIDGTTTTGSPIDLAELVVDGPPDVTQWPDLPARTVPDLRGRQLSSHRTITLAMGMEMQGPVGMSFTIDGHRFDPSRVDQRVPAGAIEQWAIVNTSEMDHPFHLHIWPMQIVRVGDSAVSEPTWQNVVNVPARSSTIVLIRFDAVTGRTVYHCHILDHEDAGMMGVVEVR